MQHKARLQAQQKSQYDQQQRHGRVRSRDDGSLSGVDGGGSDTVEERLEARLRRKSLSSDRTPPTSTSGDRLQQIKLRRISQPVMSSAHETRRLYLGRASSPPSLPSRENDLDRAGLVRRQPRPSTAAAAPTGGLARKAIRGPGDSADEDNEGAVTRVTRRKSITIDPTALVLKDNNRARALRHKSQRTYLSREYESSPIVKRTSPSPPGLPALPSKRHDKARRRDQQRQDDGTRERSNSSGSSSEESRAWDEFDVLKSRIRQLERTSRGPSSNVSVSSTGASRDTPGHDGDMPHSAARRHFARSISDDRPHTSTTTPTTGSFLHHDAGLGTSAGIMARFNAATSMSSMRMNPSCCIISPSMETKPLWIA